MRGVYKIQDVITSVTTAKVLLYVKSPTGKPLEILSAHITSEDEETNEQFVAQLVRVASGTVGGGDALTPKPTEEGSAAFAGTAKGGNTAITGLTADGDDDAIHRAGANKQGSGWEYMPMPEEREILAAGDEMILETKSTITSASLHCLIVVREIG